MTRAEAEKLQAAVNLILKQARQLPDHERVAMGAINWGDLNCTDVEERKSLLTDSCFQAVIIEEASPDAEGLRKFVGERLDVRGYRNVYVETEW